MKKEIEILWVLETKIEDCLGVLNQRAKSSKSEITDLYFVDPKRDDLKPIEFRLNHCLRIREIRKADIIKSYITFKKDFFDDDVWLYSDENETEIESFNDMKSILEKLGFEVLIEIINTKTKFIIDNYEIVIEKVKDLGNFLEIEIIDSEGIENIEEAKEEIRTFLNALGIKVGDEMNAGKPELMLRKNNN
jgi:predicted adenylyl cyclase CyaB